MCCFSRPVRFVGSTRIFARRLAGGRQALAYAMQVEIDEALAMVLPLPVPPGVAEDAVEFVDLSGYPGFFDDLARAFPAVGAKSQGPLARGAPAPATLRVHEVGDFVASFVPSQADFARLDARFRLPADVFAKLPEARDDGFAVFQLAPKRGRLGFGVRRQAVHPMAFTFPTRHADALFFPTVHVHDGSVPATARFDHSLFCQDDGVLGATLPWDRSTAPLGRFVRGGASGLVDPDRPGWSTSLVGPRPNRDVVLAPPAGLRLDDLDGGVEGARYRLNARAHYGFYDHLPSAAAWRRASARLPDVGRALTAGLPAIARDFGLVPLAPELPPHFLNGTSLWTGTSWLDGAPVTTRGPGQLVIEEFTDHVEPQTVRLGFATVPDPPTLARLRDRLRALLDEGVEGGIRPPTTTG